MADALQGHRPRPLGQADAPIGAIPREHRNGNGVGWEGERDGCGGVRRGGAWKGAGLPRQAPLRLPPCPITAASARPYSTAIPLAAPRATPEGRCFGGRLRAPPGGGRGIVEGQHRFQPSKAIRAGPPRRFQGRGGEARVAGTTTTTAAEARLTAHIRVRPEALLDRPKRFGYAGPGVPGEMGECRGEAGEDRGAGGEAEQRRQAFGASGDGLEGAGRGSTGAERDAAAGRPRGSGKGPEGFRPGGVCWSTVSPADGQGRGRGRGCRRRGSRGAKCWATAGSHEDRVQRARRR
mmetsp:Transcript_15544/g.38339  ORF Transcript_15544/g.38339 Transcript_15544/m.38339 type:complete len:293 (+) Transcript_15544:794-1672(+)